MVIFSLSTITTQRGHPLGIWIFSYIRLLIARSKLFEYFSDKDENYSSKQLSRPRLVHPHIDHRQVQQAEASTIIIDIPRF